MRFGRFSTIAVALLCGGAVLVAHPSLAVAHTLPSVFAARLRPAVTSVTPQDPHLKVTCTADGQGLQVTYTGSQPLIVKGYGGEDYLRIGPTGVDQNERSPSLWFNQNRTLDGAPDYSAALQPPLWRHVSAARTVSWYDSRLHWLGSDTPPGAQADPRHSHVLKTWVVTMTIGTTATEVVGTVTWVPGASSSRVLIIELSLEGLGFAAAVLLVWRYHVRSRRPRLGGSEVRRRLAGS
jgi:hypothetical protein